MAKKNQNLDENVTAEEQEQEAIAEAVEYEATRHMFYDATRESA